MPRRDVVWIDVLPTPRGFARGVNKELGGVGRSAGKQLGRDLEQSTKDAAERAARAMEDRMDRARGSVQRASDAITAARAKEADSAGKVATAEAQVQQARAGSTAAASKVTEAERRLDETRRRGGTTAAQLAAAQSRLDRARAQSAQAATRETAAEQRLSASHRAVEGAQRSVSSSTSRLASAQARLSRTQDQVAQSARRMHQASAGDGRAAAALQAINGLAGRAGRSMALAAAGGTALAGSVVGLSSGVGVVASLAAETGRLANTLLLLPGAAAAGAAAIGTLAVGGQGLSDAFSAVFDDATTSASGVRDAAGAAQQAAEQIRSARLAVRDATENLAVTEQQAARDAITSARAVSSAQRAAADARVQAAEATRAAVQSVRDAERGLASAQRESITVQAGLSAAREEARRSLTDMAFDVRGAALEQRRAAMDFADARDALDAARAGSTSPAAAPPILSPTEQGLGLPSPGAAAAPVVDTRAVQEARLAFDSAKLAYDQVNVRVKRLAVDSAAANRAGVNESQQVAAAQDAIRSALERVGDARRQLTDATRTQVQTQVDGARQIADAQLGVRDAVEAQRWQQVDTARAVLLASRQVTEAQRGVGLAAAQAGTAGSAAVDKANDALGALSPNARAAVLAVKQVWTAFRPAQQGIQDRLFAGVAADVRALGSQYAPVLERGMLGVAGSFNFAARDAAGFLRQSSTVADVGTIFANTGKTTDILARSLRPVLAGLTDIATVGSNYLPELAGYVERVAIRFRDWAAGARASGELDRRIRAGIQSVKDLFATLRNLGVVTRNVFGQGARDQELFFAATRRATGEMRAFTDSAAGQAKIQGFFDTLHQTAENLKPGFRDLGSALFGGFDDANVSLPQLATGFSHVLSAVADLVGPVRDLLIPLTAGKLAGFTAGIQAVADVLALLTPILQPLMPTLGFLLGLMGTAAVAARLATGPLGLMATSFKLVTTEAARARWGTAIATQVSRMTAPITAGIRNIKLFASTFVAGARQAAAGAVKSAATTVKAWASARVAAARSAAGQALAAARVNAQRFGGLVASNASAVRSWASARIAAGLSAARQVANAVRVNAIRFSGLIAGNAAAVRSWASARLASFLSMTRQVANAVRVNTIRFGGLIASHARLAAAWVRSGMTAMVSGIRQKAAAVAMGVARAATWAMTFAQRALNVAMRANPIGIIITALIAIGTALVTAYHKSKTFRDIVNKIGEVAHWVWKNVFEPFFGFLGDVWSWTIQPIIDAVKWVIKKGGEFFKWVGSLFGAKDGAIVEASVTRKADGGVVAPMAAGGVLGMAGGGGLTPMAPKAQAVAPNTWRVVGDRLRGREYYIPEDGSKRSLGILMEAARSFGMNLVPMLRGGILALAAGGTLAAGPAAPAAAATSVPVSVNATASTVADPAEIAKTTAATKALSAASTVLQAEQAKLTTANRTQTATLGRLGTAGLTPTRNRILTQTVPALRTMQVQAGVHTTRAVRVLTQSTAPLRGAMNMTAANVRATWQRNAVAVQSSVNRQRAAFGGVQTGLSRTRGAMTQTANWAQREFGRMYGAAAAPTRRTITGPINGIVRAWNKIASDFQLKPKVKTLVPGFAGGGDLHGPGTGTSDSFMIRASDGEFMVRERIASLTRPFLRALNAGQPEAVQAAGGFRAKMPPGYARGGDVFQPAKNDALARVDRFGRKHRGKPYEWAGSGPGGWDCSGWIGSLALVAQGDRNPFRRIFSTASFAGGGGAAGFQPGLKSAFGIGVFQGNPGHVAATIGGTNAESGGSHNTNAYGPPAVGAKHPQFNQHFHLPFVGGRFIGGGGGGGSIDPATITGPAFDPIKQQIAAIAHAYRGNQQARIATGIASKAQKNVRAFANRKLSEALMSSGAAGGGGVQRWAPMVLRALRIMGQPASLLQTVLRRMNQESGGDPNIVNGWDSNAAKGTPSVGLMQVIGPTYRSNRHPRFDVGPYVHGTSVNPLANTLASMRYALGRYGSLSSAYNRPGGYDNGGWLMPGYTQVWNGTRSPEAVFTSQQLTNLTKGGDGADLEGMEISGTLELGEDGFARIIDGRIEKAKTRDGDRARHGRRP